MEQQQAFTNPSRRIRIEMNYAKFLKGHHSCFHMTSLKKLKFPAGTQTHKSVEVTL